MELLKGTTTVYIYKDSMSVFFYAGGYCTYPKDLLSEEHCIAILLKEGYKVEYTDKLDVNMYVGLIDLLNNGIA